MQISVLVEPVGSSGYRAQGSEPFGFSAEGATRDEAIAKIRKLCQERLSSGAEMVTLDLESGSHPWLPFAGMFKDDTDFQDVVEIIAKNRQAMDQDPTVP